MIKRRFWVDFVLSGATLIWLILALAPLLWLLSLSLKTQLQAFATPPLLIFKPTFVNYVDLLQNTDFARYFGNSIVVALGSVSLSLLLGVPAAYAFSRQGFRGKNATLVWILVVRMTPAMTYVIPFFMIYKTVGLLDTWASLIILYTLFTLALVIWTMQAFFDEVPRSLEEAARVDGATVGQSFVHIVLPVSGPGIAATAVLCFLFSWNEFLFALVMTRNAARTAPLAIVNFMAYEGAEWGRIAAGSVLVLLPVLIFGFVTRKYLVQGLLGGAIKG
ncbi:MAG TPA: carbohydrate ABC transporter permease [Chloroflexota bacterium]|nr:carbohydrate ABC transporter permease [Chloroflexota bacterium]